MAKLSILKLRSKKSLLLSSLFSWYTIYFQLVIPFLSENTLEKELQLSLSNPIDIYVDEQKNWQFCSHVLFFYMLFDYPSQLSVENPIEIRKSSQADYNKKFIFDELIALINRNSRYLPLKTIYHSLKRLLILEDCQLWFKKNIFSIKQFCELVDISKSTFTRAK